MNASNANIQKPIPLRIIFILNGLMTILPFIFYFVFTTFEITVGSLNPIIMVYTGIGYIVSFIFLVSFILRKNLPLVRIVLAVNILIAVPASAWIGVFVAIISLVLTFTNSKVMNYFNS